MAINRIHRELDELRNNPSINCMAEQGEDLYNWDATIIGPEETPYAGGHFLLKIHFSQEYPFRPPTVQFMTKVYHPNISSQGVICLDILHKQWSPALTITKVLLSISSLLSDPNPDDPLVSEVAKLYKCDRKAFSIKAQEWTRQYAIV